MSRVLGVGDDEVLTLVLPGADPCELLVHALHDSPSWSVMGSAQLNVGGGAGAGMAPVMIATASDIV